MNELIENFAVTYERDFPFALHLKCRYTVYESPSVDPILSQINRIRVPIPQLFYLHFQLHYHLPICPLRLGLLRLLPISYALSNKTGKLRIT